MRFKVFLRECGKNFDEVIIANNKAEALKIALENNPKAKVINAYWTYKI